MKLTNSDFAKVFRSEYGGQILIMRDSDDGEPAIKIFIEPEGFGTCSMALRYNDNDDGWDKRDEIFSTFTKEEAKSCASSLLKQLEELCS